MKNTVRSARQEPTATTRSVASVINVRLVISVLRAQKVPRRIPVPRAHIVRRVLERRSLVLLVPMVTDL